MHLIRSITKPLVFSGLLLAGLLLANGLAMAGQASIKLRLASITPPPGKTVVGDAIKLWMDKVSQATEGKVSFQTYWGASLGSGPSHIDLLEKGMVDIAITLRWYTPSKFPLGQFEYVIPFGPTDPLMVAVAKRKLYEEFPQFKANLAKHNAVYIAGLVACPYQFMSKTPIKTVDDLKGKKVSLVGRYFGRLVSGVGAAAVVAPMHDRYTMLQTGVTDVDLLPFDSFYSFKIYEVAPNYVQIDACTVACYDLLINAKTWNKLSPETQKAMQENGKWLENHIAKNMIPEYIKMIMAVYKEKGVTHFKLPDAERSKWANVLQDIPAEWAAEVEKQGMPGFAIIQRYQELTADMGYKWPRKWAQKK